MLEMCSCIISDASKVNRNKSTINLVVQVISFFIAGKKLSCLFRRHERNKMGSEYLATDERAKKVGKTWFRDKTVLRVWFAAKAIGEAFPE